MTNIAIQDDDVVTVSFAQSSYSYQENEGLATGIILTLSTDIVQPFSVRVTGGPGQQPSTVNVSGTDVDQTVNFAARDQGALLTSFTIVDDEIALEDNEIFPLTLASHNFPDSNKVTLGSNTGITISDDDGVTVMFGRPEYDYNENDGDVSGTIAVLLSKAVARDLSVTVVGGPGSQPSTVNVSGFSVNSAINFDAFGSQRIPLTNLNIRNDNTALETVERYQLAITNPSFTMNVQIGNSSYVNIRDDDVVGVSFGRSMYTYSENQGTVTDIIIQLNTTIASDLAVNVAGGPGSQPSTVVISGANVASSVTFSAGGSVQETLPSFVITNDTSALETDERYQLSLTGQSFSDSSKVVLGPMTNIVIQDDDSVTVSFARSSYSYQENAGSATGIMLTLSTDIVQPFSVNVTGGPGQQPSTVIPSGPFINRIVSFAVGDQQRPLGSFSFIMDNVALETNEVYPLELSSPNRGGVVLGPDTEIVIVDDDVVSVRFNETMNGARYIYDEDDGDVLNIVIELNTTIARDLSVRVTGGPFNQPSSVIVSGFFVDQVVSFEAHGARMQLLLDLNVTDDEVALETEERYLLSLSDPSITMNVVLGIDNGVIIRDNDEVMVEFVRQMYTYLESHGTVSNIAIRLSTEIAQDLNITVQADPPNIYGRSGTFVNEVITFESDNSLTERVPSFQIMDDSIALERNEIYEIGFVESSITDDVVFGNAAQISITDDDPVTVMFGQQQYSYSENAGSVTDITAVLDRPIAQNLTVQVFGESGNQPSSVEPSGFTVNQSITFPSQVDNPAVTLGPFTIRNDTVALETVESYTVDFTSATFPRRVVLGPNTGISISDDDYVGVMFSQTEYVYPEDHGEVSDIMIRVNTTIAQALQVTITGGPGNQPSTVAISGADVSSVITFAARGNVQETLPPFNITDDSLALETDEIYSLRFDMSVPTRFVVLGQDAVIRITDDEMLSVSFDQRVYSNSEGQTGRMLVVQLSHNITQDFNITISGVSGPQMRVENNGPAIMETIMFMGRSLTSYIYRYDVGDDDLALENVESYQVSLSNPSHSATLAPSSTIRIEDNDVARVFFVADEYSFLESAGLTMEVTVTLSNRVARQISVRVFGDPGSPSLPIVNSGTIVNQTLTFQANDSSQANLVRIIPVQIIDDDVSREGVQTYSLEFQNLPSDVMTGTFPQTTLIINDDDTAVIRMATNMVRFNESAMSADITVILTGSVAEPTSVDVRDGNGNLVRRVTFEPRVGVLMQAITFSIPYSDDNIALEPTEEYLYSLSNSTVDIGLPNTTTHFLVDDDPLRVTFVEPLYTFNETDGFVVIQAMLSNPIARVFTVRTEKVLRTQPNVHESGPDFQDTLIFQANSSVTTLSIRGFVRNDDIALEDVEEYQVQFTSPNPSPSNDSLISIGPPTTIRVISEDVAVVTLGTDNAFEELSRNNIESISVSISSAIIRPLAVTVESTYLPDPLVEQSGQSFNTTVTFLPDGATTLTFNFPVMADDVAFENVERERLSFRSSSPSDGVVLGPDANATITDIDTVNIMFVERTISVSENSTQRTVQVMISDPIRRNVQVQVIGSSDPNQRFVDTSGVDFNGYIEFMPNGPDKIPVNIIIEDDDTALESVERYTLFFNSSNPTTRVMLGNASVISIVDDDTLTASFASSMYSFSEADGNGLVQVMIDRPIARNFNIQVQGGPGNQGPNVAVSGTNVARTLVFMPGSPRRQNVTFTINDDTVALEDTEMYPLSLTNPNPSTRVTVGPMTSISITDDDAFMFGFTAEQVRVLENGGGATFSFTVSPTVRSVRFNFTQVDGPLTNIIESLGQLNCGQDANGILNRPASTSLQTIECFAIVTNDTVALENNETSTLNVMLINPDPRSFNVQPGRLSTSVIVQDDDVLTYGFTADEVRVLENGGRASFQFMVTPTVRGLSFNFTQVDGPLTDIIESLGQLNCVPDGNGRNQILNVPPSMSVQTVDCHAIVTNDTVALENDETSTLNVMLIDPDPRAQPGTVSTSVTVEDDDGVVITMVDNTTRVIEGEVTVICAEASTTSVRPITVMLGTMDGTATSPDDYIGVSQSRVIPAGSTGPVCISVQTQNDTRIEANETFTTNIVSMGHQVPNAANPGRATIGNPRSTTSTIVDVSVPSRVCMIGANFTAISTFGTNQLYPFNRSCEHSLVLGTAQMSSNTFEIAVDSLDGMYATTRLGIRYNNELLVVNAFNQTVIREENLNNLTYTRVPGSITIEIRALSVSVTASAAGISININEGSLQSRVGLCGNTENGFVFRNGSAVDITNSYDLNKAIGQYSKKPSDTFLRMNARRGCGLLSTDVETGDPMFTVPLYTPDLPRAHTYSLCYEIHGSADDYYNFVSDSCVSVNAHYFSTDDPDPDSTRNFHGVDSTHIIAVDNRGECKMITVTLNRNTNLCTTTLDDAITNEYSSDGVSVRVAGNVTTITAPNCADNGVEMIVNCSATSTGIGYQEFRVLRGLDLNEVSHGLIGQFWNVEASVSKYNNSLRDGSVGDNTYLVEIRPRNKSPRRFIGFLEDTTWDFTPQPCIYVGNSQGGPIYEVQDGEPNDSLIEGSYDEYEMDDAFDVEFDYGHFERDCTNTGIN